MTDHAEMISVTRDPDWPREPWESAPIDVCAGCGQTLLTTPDDPMRSLWCDTCEGGAK